MARMKFARDDRAYIQYVHDFKVELKRLVSLAINEDVASQVAKHGYIYLPSKRNHLYKFIVSPTSSHVYAASFSKDLRYLNTFGNYKLPKPGDHDLIVWSFCVGGSVSELVHENLQGRQGGITYCKACRMREISDFVSWYLMIQADEAAFLRISNWGPLNNVSYEQFDLDTGMTSMPLNYSKM